MTETPNPYIVDADTMTGEMRPIRRVVVCLGSNLGERQQNLQGGLSALLDTPGITISDVSPVYESAPVGGPEGAGDFLNVVVSADTTLSPHTLLDRCLAIEDAFGRERTERNAPRTLDLDLIVVGDQKIEDDDLVLPHPRAHERLFVLQPWHDVDPEAYLPGHGWVVDLLADLAEGTDPQRATRRDDRAVTID
ncbi:MAG: 2-amino-4-hydroxy-6-hydroxymethyldihydropteridine diphosphokinase [Actinomycetota bacterium]|nr:2-amino-4-hydroxy-6-hydroxymethyldihydropteridine diphosphokinase [Nocardioidaceae bacterium]MDQ3592179.1 2-amino-4-hydroxy-6-hydroxymethyldihydropteridine diphosphokinase [Actinomycetota bacterium]